MICCIFLGRLVVVVRVSVVFIDLLSSVMLCKLSWVMRFLIVLCMVGFL